MNLKDDCLIYNFEDNYIKTNTIIEDEIKEINLIYNDLKNNDDDETIIYYIFKCTMLYNFFIDNIKIFLFIYLIFQTNIGAKINY